MHGEVVIIIFKFLVLRVRFFVFIKHTWWVGTEKNRVKSIKSSPPPTKKEHEHNLPNFFLTFMLAHLQDDQYKMINKYYFSVILSEVGYFT